MADWVTISSLATAGGTLVLAVATFSSVRSANRSARVAERSLLAGLRPVLIPRARTTRWSGSASATAQSCTVPGPRRRRRGRTTTSSTWRSALRNGGTGLAVIHGWRARPCATTASSPGSGRPDERARPRRVPPPAARPLHPGRATPGTGRARCAIPTEPSYDEVREALTTAARSRSTCSTATTRAASARSSASSSRRGPEDDRRPSRARAGDRGPLLERRPRGSALAALGLVVLCRRASSSSSSSSVLGIVPIGYVAAWTRRRVRSASPRGLRRSARPAGRCRPRRAVSALVAPARRRACRAALVRSSVASSPLPVKRRKPNLARRAPVCGSPAPAESRDRGVDRLASLRGRTDAGDARTTLGAR